MPSSASPATTAAPYSVGLQYEHQELFDVVIDGAVARVRQEVERNYTSKGAGRPGDLLSPEVYRALSTIAAARPDSRTLSCMLSLGPSGMRLNSLPADFDQDEYDALVDTYFASVRNLLPNELPLLPVLTAILCLRMESALLLLGRADDSVDWRQHHGKRKENVLHAAARRDMPMVIKALLSPPHGVPLDVLSGGPYTALVEAAGSGATASLRCLLQHLPEQGWTVEQALANGNLRDVPGIVSLPLVEYAIGNNQAKVIEMLVDEFNESVFAPRSRGRSFASSAVYFSARSVVEWILNTWGFDELDKVCSSDFGQGVLLLACTSPKSTGDRESLRLPVVQALLEAGANDMDLSEITEAADAAQAAEQPHIAKYLLGHAEKMETAARAEAELLAELEAEEQQAAAKKSKKKKKKEKAKGKAKGGKEADVAEATAALAAVAVGGGVGGNDAKDPPAAATKVPHPQSAPPLDPEEAFLRQEAPSHNLCPLSGALLTEAVIGSDGVTYQQEALERWIEAARREGKPLLSPSTGEPMQELCIPNMAVRSLVRAYAEAKRKEWAAMNK